MERSTQRAREEWRANWPLVLAALAGSSFAAVPVQSITFFIDPISADLKWSRTQISIGLTIFAIIVAPLSPVMGAMIDRWGPRRIAIAGVALGSIMMASLGLTTGSIKLWIAQWVIYAFAALAMKVTVWTAAVSNEFDHGRGMAIAVALCGTALSQTIAPLLSFWLIDAVGWRGAFFGLALGWGGGALVLLLLFFKSDYKNLKLRAEKAAQGYASLQAALPGLSIGEAARSMVLYRIALALVIGSTLSVAVITHKVSIINEMGMSRMVAAEIAATAGIAGIAGKLITGWLYDRFSTQWIGIAAFGLPAIGFAMLLEPIRTPLTVVLGMIVLGYAAGASLQATAYLVPRYAGMRNYGKIFGTLGSITVLVVGLGPLVGGLIYDNFHSYEPLFIIGVPLCVLNGLLVMGFGPYPDWRSAAGTAEAAPASGIPAGNPV